MFEWYLKRGEARSLENPNVSLSQGIIGLFNGGNSLVGEPVTEEAALGVPAIFAAVNIISGTIASLPLHLYSGAEETSKTKATKDPLYTILHDRANAEETSFMFRKRLATRLLLGGRAVAFIERNKAGRVMNLWMMDTDHLIVERRNDRRSYHYVKEGKPVVYQANEVLDFNLMPTSNGLNHYNPIQTNRNTIGLIIAAEKYGAILLGNNGVPPMVLNGDIMSPEAASRASGDIEASLKRTRDEKRSVLVTPTGYKLEPIGIDPAKQQLLELRQFLIAEVSRIFNIAPAMLHDLSNGTYSNVEQQDLHFTKHTIRPIVELIEQEMNLKLFSDRSKNYAEFSLDGLMRGDFATRMSGIAQGIQNGVMTPNEARALENREPLPGGDSLYIQGATVPLAGQAAITASEPTIEPTAEEPAVDEPTADEDAE